MSTKARFLFASAFALLLIFTVFVPSSAAVSPENDGLAMESAILTAPLSEAGENNFEILGIGHSYRLLNSGGEIVFEGGLQDAVYAAPEGAVLKLTAINCEGNLSLSKSIKLTGELYVSGGSVIINSDCLFENLSLTLNGGSVRIKDATLSLTGGRIASDSESALILDYSVSSVLNVYSGEILQSSYAPAIFNKRGCVNISGGNIESVYSVGIENSSTLKLSGAPMIKGYSYSVITDNPIWLSEEEKQFSSELSVMFRQRFIKGSFTTVFYGATKETIEKISFYDESGENISLRFFGENAYTEDKNLLAVYLPFSVRFYLDGELYLEKLYISGEKISPPISPVRMGHSFIGWFSDGQSSEEFNFEEAVSADISLYGKFCLMPPEFAISSLSFVYDGGERALTFDRLYHPLMEEGAFSFEWFKNQEPLGIGSPAVPISRVSDSGEYSCRLSFSSGGSFVTVTTLAVSVNVNPCPVEAPKINEKEFTGGLQIADIVKSNLYTARNDGGINVGDYPVILTLTDSENYCFADSKDKELELVFRIVKAENSFIIKPSVRDGFLGLPLVVGGSSYFGNLEFYYSEAPDGIWSKELPKSAGVYYFKGVVEGTENYFPLESNPVCFRIEEEAINGIIINTPPVKTHYKAFELLELGGISVYATYNSGRSVEVEESLLSTVYRNGNCLLAGDSSVLISYGDFSAPLSVSVEKATYDLSGIVFTDKTVIYDGKRYTAEAIGDVIGLDGIPLQYKTYGGGSDAGKYEIILNFTVESPNYHVPSTLTATLEILPKELTVSYGETEFIYDGKGKAPSAEIVTVEGLTVKLDLAPAGINAGSYTATATFDNNNYSLKNPTVEFVIKKADFDLSGISWSENSFIYTGMPHSVTVNGIPDGVEVIGYINAEFSDAGKYRAVASIYYDERNYNTPPEISHSWEIMPAEYDLSGFEIHDTVAVFDGNMHYPILSGTLPTGVDGIPLRINIGEGASSVSQGKVKVKITFLTDSLNYRTPEPVYRFVQITPKTVNVDWGSLEFTYNGEKQKPAASLTECGVKVLGEAADAGEYTATAIPESSDYVIENADVTFVIKKAQNYWVEEPNISNSFFGHDLKPVGNGAGGNMEFIYYADEELATPIQYPAEVGVYYMVAISRESGNFLELISHAVRFEILAILPVGIRVELGGFEATALTLVPNDAFTVVCVNNDGSEAVIPWNQVNISYENGDLPRVSDNSLTVEALGFSQSISIKVNKAFYDTSITVWRDTEHTYDGNIKSAYLEGLPSGVKLLYYKLNSATDAGAYKLEAVLEYDSENYNAPTLPEAYLIINRQNIPLPNLETFVYDGKKHSPCIEKNDIYDAFITEGSAAGQYKVTLAVKNGNYSFSGKNTAELYFSILRRDITLKVTDNDEFEVAEGSIVQGDELRVEFFKENGYLSLKCSDPNYTVTVIPLAESKIKDTLWLWFVVFLATLLFALLCFAVFTKRDRLILLLGRRGSADDEEITKDIPESRLLVTDEAHASALISDAGAKSLLRKSEVKIKTRGDKRAVVNIDVISAVFKSGERVDINSMKEKGLIPEDCAYVKVLARGVIDKPLTVTANSFSLAAVKMIALTGGKAVIAKTQRIK